MSGLSRKIRSNRKWIAPVAAAGTGGMSAGLGAGLGASGAGSGAGAGASLGGLTGGLPSRGAGGFGADFTGQDMRQQQDFNVGLLQNAYNAIVSQLGQIGGPGTEAYTQLGSQYGQQLQQGIDQSGLAGMYGPQYGAQLQQLALRSGDQGGLAASRLASQVGAGRGGGFGGAGANQVRQASMESSMGTQQALLGAQAGAEQGRAGVAGQLAQLLAGGAQNQLQAGLTGLGAQQQLALGRLNNFSGLGNLLLGGLAKVSPEDTNKTFENSLKALQAMLGSGSGGQGGAVGGAASGLGMLGII